MKRIVIVLLALVAIAFTSCSKETTCQLVNKSGANLTEITIYELSSAGDIIDAGYVGNLADGDKTTAFTMQQAATMVKVAFRNNEGMKYTTRIPLADNKKNVVEINATTPTTDDLYD